MICPLVDPTHLASHLCWNVRIIAGINVIVLYLHFQRSEDEDSLEGNEETAEVSRKRRRFDEAALERKRELRLWNEQRRVYIDAATIHVPCLNALIVSFT